MGIEALSVSRLNISGERVLADLHPAVRVKIGLVPRFRRWVVSFVEESDWDDRILKMGKRVDLVCWAAVLALAICVLPALIKAFL